MAEPGTTGLDLGRNAPGVARVANRCWAGVSKAGVLVAAGILAGRLAALGPARHAGILEALSMAGLTGILAGRLAAPGLAGSLAGSKAHGLARHAGILAQGLARVAGTLAHGLAGGLGAKKRSCSARCPP